MVGGKKCKLVSRVLFSVRMNSFGILSFIWSHLHRRDLAAYPPQRTVANADRAGHDRGLFGLTTRKVYHASNVTIEAVGSYPTFSPLPL